MRGKGSFEAPMSTQLLRTLCKSERLHCHSASGLCLLLGESSPKKKKKGQKCVFFFVFFPLTTLQGPEALTIFGL